MSYSPLLVQLIDALRCMPGVGRKSAQRIAFHLLERDRDGASHLSVALSQAVKASIRYFSFLPNVLHHLLQFFAALHPCGCPLPEYRTSFFLFFYFFSDLFF